VADGDSLKNFYLVSFRNPMKLPLRRSVHLDFAGRGEGRDSSFVVRLSSFVGGSGFCPVLSHRVLMFGGGI